MNRRRGNPLPGILCIMLLALISVYIIFLRIGDGQIPPLFGTGKSIPAPVTYIPGPPMINSDGVPFSVPKGCLSTNGQLGIYALCDESFSEESSLYSVGPYLYILSPGEESSSLKRCDVRSADIVKADSLPGLDAAGRGTDWFCGTLDDGSFWLAYAAKENGTVLLIYSDCREVFRLEEDFRASFVSVMPNGEEAVFLSGRELISYSLAAGEENSCVARENTVLPEMLFMSSGGALYGCDGSGTDICSVDPKTWAITPVSADNDISVLTKDYCSLHSFESGNMTAVSLSAADNRYVLLGESASAMRSSGQYAIDGKTLVIIDPPAEGHNYGRRVYDLTTGKLIQYLQYADFGDSCSRCRCLVCNEDYGWSAYLDPQGRIQLFSIDEDMFRLADRGVTAAFPDTECGRLAREIFIKTGAIVHWGEDGNSFRVENFKADRADDEKTLSTMISLRDFLCSLPEKMVTEMLMGTAEEMHIYLCSNVRTVPDLGFGVGGFTELNDGRFTVIFDIDDDYWTDGNIAHEFWHVMEYRMVKLEELTGRKFLSGWLDIMPEEMRALYLEEGSESISDQWLGSEKYTADGETDDSRIWFIRSYSISDPSEDRATIFETVNWGEKCHIVKSHTHLREKAGYLCSLIRACFPCCAEAETLPWEEKLEGEVPTWFFDRTGANRIS